ncbi:MAG TPA: YceI family protein [Solirubrobacteraceae bacterium]|nr:YceI family protein [Solirubrobacteraceae bacterium]
MAETYSEAVAAGSLPQGTWVVDPVHSSIGFQVKHLGIANVRGEFGEFEGRLVVTDSGASASGTVEAASVDTGQSQRDDHLRSADFFEVEKYPQITFASTEITPVSDGQFEVKGDLTIHGVTRPITLEAELEGYEPSDMQGKERIGVSATTKISRSDFEIKFDAALGSGNKVVGDQVKIFVEISAQKQD